MFKRIPLPSIRQLMVAAGLAAVAAAGYGVWRSTRPRTIVVCVVSDYAFRNQHAKWTDVLAARFDAANQAFRGTGVQWNFRDAGQPDPTRTLPTIEERRQKLIRTECAADIIVGITSLPGAHSDVPPFAHTAIIADAPSEPESRNTERFVRGLAALFGTPSNSAEAIPAPFREVISRLRDYDFAAGTEAIHARWHSRVFEALAAAYTGANAAAEAHGVMGMSLAADGRYVAAIAEFQERLRLDPGNPAAHLDLGSAYAHHYDTAESIAEFREAVKLAPNSAANHAAVAVALANAGLAEDAADEFRAALRIDPKFAPAVTGFGYLLSQQPGRIDEAIATYEQAVAIDPKLAAAVEGLERAKSLKRDAAAEVVEQRRKAQQAPADPLRHFDLGLAEARAGNVDTAVQELRRAVDLDGANGLAHEQLALLLYRKGDSAAALGHAETAAQKGYEAPHDIMERLRRARP